MLQQTTVVAVIPYYEKFLTRFPNVTSLAQANLEEVLEYWSGLGYYSRARNLHKAAQLLAEGKNFPTTYQQLIQYPGFGPYTSRAVASLAFEQDVGVLDGNVIRVLSRVFGLSVAWWNSKEKEKLQTLSDQLSQLGFSSLVNQGLMELGATVCTPQKPNCLLCPWRKHCIAFEKGLQEKLPLKKPRKKSQPWLWTPLLIKKQNKWAFIENDYAPFLKNQLIFPGMIKLQKTKPKKFDLLHKITHHDIYVSIQNQGLNNFKKGKIKWLTQKELKKVSPSSLLQKVLQQSS